MKTNELKKGAQVLLRNGWKATIEDNMRGNIRMCTVYGDYTEMGSVYAHDIVARQSGIQWMHDIELTKSQQQCMDINQKLGLGH